VADGDEQPGEVNGHARTVWSNDINTTTPTTDNRLLRRVATRSLPVVSASQWQLFAAPSGERSRNKALHSLPCSGGMRESEDCKECFVWKRSNDERRSQRCCEALRIVETKRGYLRATCSQGFLAHA